MVKVDGKGVKMVSLIAMLWLVCLIKVTNAIVGYPYQFWYQCTKPVENFQQSEVAACYDLKEPGVSIFLPTSAVNT